MDFWSSIPRNSNTMGFLTSPKLQIHNRHDIGAQLCETDIVLLGCMTGKAGSAIQ